MKIWRALWKACAAFNLCDAKNDPSQPIRRITPQCRSAIWAGDEVERLIDAAWQLGYQGAAVIVSIVYDTGFSPVDARRLAAKHWSSEGFRIARSKTGQPAIGTLSSRTTGLINTYLADKGEQFPAAPLFRNRSGAPYSKDTLGDDFRAIRAAVFPGDTRKLMDVRRTVAIEALAGGATADQIGAKLANTIGSNSELQRTYLPGNVEVVRLVDEARRRGRVTMNGTKV
jgi:hypothetical protein